MCKVMPLLSCPLMQNFGEHFFFFRVSVLTTREKRHFKAELKDHVTETDPWVKINIAG